MAATLLACHGPGARAWIDALPDRITDLGADWRIAVGAPLPDLTYHLVMEATLEDGRSAILKLGPPDRERSTEILALEAYAGRGAARLLAADAERGALLLERLQPGDPLITTIGPTGSGDDLATMRAAALMPRLWQAAVGSRDLPSMGDWGRGFQRLRRRFAGGCGPLPGDLVDRAERRFAELLASAAPPRLLHGDLHHGNILRDGDGWRAIDPKGLLGEAAFEVGALLRNPWPALLDWPDPTAHLARRATILAESLGLDRRRILGWGMAQAVLAACWSIEDAAPARRQADERARAESVPEPQATPALPPSMADGTTPDWAFAIGVAKRLAHLEDAT
ncbi:MAG: phosphotransferase [Chloroflexi bacterium]|nr:phosphotransferase [Chloroflexota bacterium]